MVDGPSKPPTEAEAERLLDAGEFRTAADVYRRLVEDRSRDAGLLVGWAKALLGDGKTDAAVAELDEALKVDPSFGEAYVVKAAVLLSLGQAEEALKLYEGGSEFVDDSFFYVAWGRLLAEMGKYEQARWRFVRAIEKDDTYAPAYLAAGDVLLRLDLAREAEERFRHAVEELNARSGEAFSGWARACFANYKPELAVEKLKTAIDVDGDSPASIEHWLDIGKIRYEQNRFAEALAASRSAMALEPSGASTLQKYRARHSGSTAAVAMNLYQEALDYSEGAIKLLAEVGGWPEAEASLHFVRGAAQAGLKLYGEAIDSYEQASETSEMFAVHAINATAAVLATQGRYGESWRQLAKLDVGLERVEELPDDVLEDEQWLAYGTGKLWYEDFEKAQDAFEEAVRSGPKNPNAWAKLMVLCLARREQNIEKESDWKWQAYAAYRKAVSLLKAQFDDSASTEPLVALGLLHLLMDELDAAEPMFEQAIRCDSSPMAPFAGLGLIHVRRGKYAEAIERFDSALVREPDSLTIKCHLADAYFRLGRHASAHDAYEEVLRVAPDNVGAQIGAGEALIELAEKSADESLYEDAEAHLTKAIDLADAIKPGSPDRKGSTGLGVRQWADLYYARGYVRGKLYEAEMATRIGLSARSVRNRLAGARRDFESAAKTHVNPHRAERAATNIRKRLRVLFPSMLTEVYAPFAVVAIAFALLVVVQVFFFSKTSFSEGKDTTAYTTLTLALLMLIVAGFYLPQVLKLKLGGIQLEKASPQPGGDGALNVPRHPFQASLHAIFEPVVPRSRMLEHTESVEEPKPVDAREGARPNSDSPVGVLSRGDGAEGQHF